MVILQKKKKGETRKKNQKTIFLIFPPPQHKTLDLLFLNQTPAPNWTQNKSKPWYINSSSTSVA
jgi:hypothetical protein